MHLFNKKHFSDLTITLFRVTELQVKTCVRDYLKYAPWRTGGIQRGRGVGGHREGHRQ